MFAVETAPISPVFEKRRKALQLKGVTESSSESCSLTAHSPTKQESASCLCPDTSISMDSITLSQSAASQVPAAQLHSKMLSNNGVGKSVSGGFGFPNKLEGTLSTIALRSGTDSHSTSSEDLDMASTSIVKPIPKKRGRPRIGELSLRQNDENRRKKPCSGSLDSFCSEITARSSSVVSDASVFSSDDSATINALSQDSSPCQPLIDTASLFTADQSPPADLISACTTRISSPPRFSEFLVKLYSTEDAYQKSKELCKHITSAMIVGDHVFALVRCRSPISGAVIAHRVKLQFCRRPGASTDCVSNAECDCSRDGQKILWCAEVCAVLILLVKSPALFQTYDSLKDKLELLSKDDLMTIILNVATSFSFVTPFISQQCVDATTTERLNELATLSYTAEMQNCPQNNVPMESIYVSITDAFEHYHITCSTCPRESDAAQSSFRAVEKAVSRVLKLNLKFIHFGDLVNGLKMLEIICNAVVENSKRVAAGDLIKFSNILQRLNVVIAQFLGHKSCTVKMRQGLVQKMRSWLPLLPKESSGGFQHAIEIAERPWDDLVLQSVLAGDVDAMSSFSEHPTTCKYRLMQLQKEENFTAALNYCLSQESLHVELPYIHLRLKNYSSAIAEALKYITSYRDACKFSIALKDVDPSVAYEYCLQFLAQFQTVSASDVKNVSTFIDLVIDLAWMNSKLDVSIVDALILKFQNGAMDSCQLLKLLRKFCDLGHLELAISVTRYIIRHSYPGNNDAIIMLCGLLKGQGLTALLDVLSEKLFPLLSTVTPCIPTSSSTSHVQASRYVLLNVIQWVLDTFGKVAEPEFQRENFATLWQLTLSVCQQALDREPSDPLSIPPYLFCLGRLASIQVSASERCEDLQLNDLTSFASKMMTMLKECETRLTTENVSDQSFHSGLANLFSVLQSFSAGSDKTSTFVKDAIDIALNLLQKAMKETTPHQQISPLVESIAKYVVSLQLDGSNSEDTAMAMLENALMTFENQQVVFCMIKAIMGKHCMQESKEFQLKLQSIILRLLKGQEENAVPAVTLSNNVKFILSHYGSIEEFPEFLHALFELQLRWEPSFSNFEKLKKLHLQQNRQAPTWDNFVLKLIHSIPPEYSSLRVAIQVAEGLQNDALKDMTPFVGTPEEKLKLILTIAELCLSNKTVSILPYIPAITEISKELYNLYPAWLTHSYPSSEIDHLACRLGVKYPAFKLTLATLKTDAWLANWSGGGKKYENLVEWLKTLRDLFSSLPAGTPYPFTWNEYLIYVRQQCKQKRKLIELINSTFG